MSLALVRLEDGPLTPDLVLPPIDYEHIEIVPPLPHDSNERTAFLELLDLRAEAIQNDSAFEGVLAAADLLERAEELAGQLELLSYAGATGLMGHINTETDVMNREAAQKRVERILIESGPARISVAFSPYSRFAIFPSLRQSLVSKLGYEPLTTGLADAAEFDRQHGIWRGIGL